MPSGCQPCYFGTQNIPPKWKQNDYPKPLEFLVRYEVDGTPKIFNHSVILIIWSVIVSLWIRQVISFLRQIDNFKG